MFGQLTKVFAEIHMRCFSYVVARDFGFAPNPFYAKCSLATCKPLIREKAEIGDWIAGFGSARYGAKEQLLFAMRVTYKSTFNEYWDSPEYQCKKPVLNGSLKQMYGDNIYHTVPDYIDETNICSAINLDLTVDREKQL